MDAEAVRFMLIRDWAEVENTPLQERQPVRLERWHHRARCLATATGRSPLAVEQELQGSARRVAADRRRELETELARDLATMRALGQEPTPPWHRRLRALAEVIGVAPESLRSDVEAAAGAIRVMVCS